MRCEICNRDNMDGRELSAHKKYFHSIVSNGQKGQKVSAGVCPECGSSVFYQEGCVNCPSCGYSKCG